MLLNLILSVYILSTFQPWLSHISQESSLTSKPVIISINTDYPKEGGWVRIPKGTEKITFHVIAENTETILFWLIPTGTQTWTKRELIGYDILESKTDKNFSLTWNINKPYLHDHLYIQAIGDETVTNELINLSME